MFIRRTKTRTSDNGTDYFSFRLVNTYRVAERVRQRTLLNLGSHFSFPHEQWSELTQRIEQIVLGQQVALLMPSPYVELEAQNIASKLLSKYAGNDLFLTQGATPKPATSIAIDATEAQPITQADRDMSQVDLNSLELVNSRSIGAEAVALTALKHVKLDQQFADLGFK